MANHQLIKMEDEIKRCAFAVQKHDFETACASFVEVCKLIKPENVYYNKVMLDTNELTYTFKMFANNLIARHPVEAVQCLLNIPDVMYVSVSSVIIHKDDCKNKYKSFSCKHCNAWVFNQGNPYYGCEFLGAIDECVKKVDEKLYGQLAYKISKGKIYAGLDYHRVYKTGIYGAERYINPQEYFNVEAPNIEHAYKNGERSTSNDYGVFVCDKPISNPPEVKAPYEYPKFDIPVCWLYKPELPEEEKSSGKAE